MLLFIVEEINLDKKMVNGYNKIKEAGMSSDELEFSVANRFLRLLCK